MGYTKIPEKDAVLLVRALGLLVSQAAVYGGTHNVTQSAARSVFAELEQAINAYGPIEIALRNQQIVINGSDDGISAVTGKNLADRMAMHKISGLLFLAPMDILEFVKCIALFGRQPMALAAEGGFGGAMKKELLRSVRVVSVAYQRVADDDKTQTSSVATPVRRQVPDTPMVGVLDLSAAWGGGSEIGPDVELDAPREQKDPETQARQKRSADLAALLRDTAALLESGKGYAAQNLQPNVADALGRIRTLLSDLAVDSDRQVSALANQVNEDRQAIASIESAARRRGIGLKLTRAELVQRYAELNQEIMQPLTVSTGVIGMLHSGCAGTLNEAQLELLKMASESVARVNQLVGYMNRISGLPETYTPDMAAIADTYR